MVWYKVNSFSVGVVLLISIILLARVQLLIDLNFGLHIVKNDFFLVELILFIQKIMS